MKKLTLATAFAALAAPALAQDPSGDAAAGEEIFNRQCATCHVVVNDAGETLAGRNAQTGPNLYGVAGRTPGTWDDFNYSDSMVEYGETGAVWEEATFVPYVQDPTGFLREALDARRARGTMAFQVRSEDDAHDVWAFPYSPAPPEGDGGS